jgi:hypothetical protein
MGPHEFKQTIAGTENPRRNSKVTGRTAAAWQRSLRATKGTERAAGQTPIANVNANFSRIGSKDQVIFLKFTNVFTVYQLQVLKKLNWVRKVASSAAHCIR